MQDQDSLPQQALLHFASLEEVFAGFSHEIAQPLNAIIIAAQVIQLKMQRSSLSEEEKLFFHERLEIVSSQVQRATRMIEKVRSFGGTDGSRSEQMNLRDLFQRIFEFMRTQFLKRGIEVDLQGDNSLPLVRNDLHIIESTLIQGLAYARDSVEALAQWHEKRGTSYEKTITITCIDDQGISAVEIHWHPGQPSDSTVSINSVNRIGLTTASEVLRSIGGVLETSNHGIVLRIP